MSYPTLVPAHNMSIWPSALPGPGMPPAAPGVVPDIDIGVHGPRAGMPTADMNSEGAITKGYVMNPQVGEFTATLIREGHILFCARGTPGLKMDKQDIHDQGISDSRTHTFNSLSMMNRTLDNMWHEGLTTIAAYKDKMQGIYAPGKSNMLKYLDLPESSWGEVYANDGKMIRDDPVFRNYYYLTRQGIMDRWNYLGFNIYASAPASQDQGASPYFPITCMTKGVKKHIANIWGPAIGQTTRLFLILKRRKLETGVDPYTGQAYGSFAFHPYSTCETTVPRHERLYVNLSGSVEIGDVIPVGMVRDNRTLSLGPYELGICQGISPDYSADMERELSKRLPVLDVAAHPRLGVAVPVF